MYERETAAIPHRDKSVLELRCSELADIFTEYNVLRCRLEDLLERLVGPQPKEVSTSGSKTPESTGLMYQLECRISSLRGQQSEISQIVSQLEHSL